jgi:hypothetical protein
MTQAERDRIILDYTLAVYAQPGITPEVAASQIAQAMDQFGVSPQEYSGAFQRDTTVTTPEQRAVFGDVGTVQQAYEAVRPTGQYSSPAPRTIINAGMDDYVRSDLPYVQATVTDAAGNVISGPGVPTREEVIRSYVDALYKTPNITSEEAALNLATKMDEVGVAPLELARALGSNVDAFGQPYAIQFTPEQQEVFGNVDLVQTVYNQYNPTGLYSTFSRDTGTGTDTVTGTGTDTVTGTGTDTVTGTGTDTVTGGGYVGDGTEFTRPTPTTLPLGLVSESTAGLPYGGGFYKRTPEEQALYEQEYRGIPVRTTVPTPVIAGTTGISRGMAPFVAPGGPGEEAGYARIRELLTSGQFTPEQIVAGKEALGVSDQDIDIAFGRRIAPIKMPTPTLPGSTAGTTQSIDEFIRSKAPTSTPPITPSMFSPENVRNQLELEQLRSGFTPKNRLTDLYGSFLGTQGDINRLLQEKQITPDQLKTMYGVGDPEIDVIRASGITPYTEPTPVAGFAQGGLVSDDINRMLQNQRNAIQRESQSRQMLTNLGVPPVKKFSDGGPAGSSSGVRRLKMSGYQDGGEVNENPYVRMAREERAAQDKTFDNVNRQLLDLLKRYKEGDEGITEKDLLPFFPGYNEYDIAQMYGTTTESSVPRMSSKARSFTPEIMSNLRKYDELMQKDFDRLVKEKRLPRDVITARTLGLAKGGEITNDEFIQEMLTGTRPEDETTSPGILPPEIRQAVDVPLDFANLLIRGTAAVPIGGVAGLYKGLTGGKYGTQEGVKEADTEAARMMAKITGEPKTQAAKDVLEFIGGKAQEYKLDAALPQLLTLPSPGPGAASALMRSYELAETPPSGVVKMPGGNWLKGQVESFVRPLKKDIPWTQDQLEEMPGVAKAEAPNLALNKFIETGLTRYIKNDMASAKDTLRNLADENTIKAGKAYNNDLRQVKKAYDRAEKIKAEGPRPNMLPGTWENAIEAQLGRARQLEEEANRKLNLELRHALPFPVLQEDGELAGGLNFHMRRNLQTGGKETLVSSRKEAGQAEEGVAQTPTGKVWETMADLFVKPQAAGQITDQDYFMRSTDSQRVLRNNPWLATVPPETPVYIPQDVFRSSSFLNSFSADDLGFKHITDELANAMNPESGLPANLLLTPDEVANMGMEKAARHVIEVNKWREEQMGVANALRAQKSISLYKDYPTIPGKTEPNQRGLQWLELKLMPEDDTPESMVKAKEALADALKYEGEVMGHCVGGECPKVESGKSRIISLRDAKGEPHVTLEVIPPEVNFSDVLGGNPAFPNRDPELYRMMDTMTTTQIEKTPLYKEKAAAIAAQKLPGISQIKGKGNNRPPDSYQPFITDFIASQQWSSVGDLQNTNLVRIEPRILKNAQDRGFNPQIVTTIKERPYITKEEFNRLADLFGGMNKYAAGGEVTDFIKRAA